MASPPGVRKVDAPKEYADSLAQSCRSLLALLVQAKAKLVEEAQSNAPGVGQRVLFVVEEVFDVLSRSSVEVAEKLSEQHKLTAKDSLKAQSVASELKMATVRKANSVQAGNQAAEMEATFNRKLDERLQELLGAGGAELYKALKTIEGLKEELNEEKLKRQGDQGQLMMFKNMLQTEQARMVTLGEEAATEREAASAHVLEIRKCLALLDVPMDADEPLHQQVEKRLERTDALAGQLAAARRELEGASEERERLYANLATLEQAMEQHDAMSAKIGDLKVEIAEMRERNSSAEAAHEKVQMLQAALAKTGKEKAALEQQVGTLLAQLEAARPTDASANLNLKSDLATVLEKLKVREVELDKVRAELAAVMQAGTGGFAAVEELQSAMRMLDEAYVELHLVKDENASVQQRVEHLVRETTTAKTKLEAVLDHLKIERTEKQTLAQSLQQLVAECERIKAECAELTAQLQASRKEQDLLGGSADKAVVFLRDEKLRLEAEIARCKDRIAETQIRPQPPATAKAGEGAPKQIKDADGRPPLLDYVELLVRKHRSVEASYVQMQDELARAASAVLEVRRRLEQAEGGLEVRVKEVRAEAKRERHVLVLAALDSLSQLRSHLTRALSGLRDAADPSQQHLAWHPLHKRWVLASEGRQDLLVLRVEMPPINLAVGYGVQTPRLHKGLVSVDQQPPRGWVSPRTAHPPPILPPKPIPNTSVLQPTAPPLSASLAPRPSQGDSRAIRSHEGILSARGSVSVRTAETPSCTAHPRVDTAREMHGRTRLEILERTPMLPDFEDLQAPPPWTAGAGSMQLPLPRPRRASL